VSVIDYLESKGSSGRMSDKYVCYRVRTRRHAIYANDTLSYGTNVRLLLFKRTMIHDDDSSTSSSRPLRGIVQLERFCCRDQGVLLCRHWIGEATSISQEIRIDETPKWLMETVAALKTD